MAVPCGYRVVAGGSQKTPNPRGCFSLPSFSLASTLWSWTFFNSPIPQALSACLPSLWLSVPRKGPSPSS